MMGFISIIGCGRVGSSIAYSLISLPEIREVLLCDKNQKKLEGEFADLSHASLIARGRNIFRKARVAEARNCKIIIICAGYPRKYETDDVLFMKNFPIIKKLLSSINFRKSTVLMVTNPSIMLSWKNGAVPCGIVLDVVRGMSDRKDGKYILARKGYTNWGIASEVKEWVKLYEVGKRN